MPDYLRTRAFPVCSRTFFRAKFFPLSSFCASNDPLFIFSRTRRKIRLHLRRRLAFFQLQYQSACGKPPSQTTQLARTPRYKWCSRVFVRLTPIPLLLLVGYLFLALLCLMLDWPFCERSTTVVFLFLLHVQGTLPSFWFVIKSNIRGILFPESISNTALRYFFLLCADFTPRQCRAYCRFPELFSASRIFHSPPRIFSTGLD